MQLTLTLPDELVAHFRSEEELRRTLYEDFVIEQRQSGAISLSRAADLLGMSYEEFFQLLGKKGLSFINATHEEQFDSFKQLSSLMKNK